MTIYMTHEKHGVHIAYSEQDVKHAEKRGWKVYGNNPPSVQPQQQQPGKTIKRRGRPRKNVNQS